MQIRKDRSESEPRSVLISSTFTAKAASVETRAGSVFAVQIVLTIELLDTATSCNGLLLTGVERMALGADFYCDFRNSRTNREFITAMASNLCLIVLRMNSFLHGVHLFHGV